MSAQSSGPYNARPYNTAAYDRPIAGSSPTPTPTPTGPPTKLPGRRTYKWVPPRRLRPMR